VDICNAWLDPRIRYSNRGQQ